MQLRIKINLDNAAFVNYPRTELSRILRMLAGMIEVHGQVEGQIHDTNGNLCGSMVFERLISEEGEP